MKATRLFQRQHEGLGIAGFERGGNGEDAAAERTALTPATQRRHAIGGCDRLAIVPLQAIAQRETIGQSVGRNVPVLHHLGLDIALGILSEQGVEHHEAKGARNIGRGKMRIERDDFRFKHRDKVAGRMSRRERRFRDQREPKQRGNESLRFGHWCLFLPSGGRCWSLGKSDRCKEKIYFSSAVFIFSNLRS
jgi:hypothetical protein